jgi:hypothetical protein
MTILDEGPTLLQCMAAAVEGHAALRKQALAPEPRRPGQIAIAKLLSGDVRGARRVMEEIERRSELSKDFNPSQARDDQGRWTSSGASSDHSSSDQALDEPAGRIANLTTSMETATAGLCAAESSPDERSSHANALVAATGQLHRELAELPDDVDQFSAASRRALGEAHQLLERVREQLHQCGILGKVRPAADDYQQAYQTVARHLAAERERAQALGKSVTLLKREEHPMRSSDLDRLESEADSLIRKISHALGEDDDGVDDDGNGYDDVSNPSMHADDDSDEPDDDEDDIGKAERYVHDHQNMAPLPFDRTHQPTTYPLNVSDAVQEPVRTKFDALVEHIRRDEGVSKTSAMTLARQRYPRIYESHQRANAASSTSAQHAARSGYGVAKRLTPTYESAVAAEMAKGCVYQVAAQRVTNMYGNALPHALGKRSDPARITKALDARIDELVADTGCDRTVALRALRKSGEYYW